MYGGHQRLTYQFTDLSCLEQASGEAFVFRERIVLETCHTCHSILNCSGILKLNLAFALFKGFTGTMQNVDMSFRRMREILKVRGEINFGDQTFQTHNASITQNTTIRQQKSPMFGVCINCRQIPRFDSSASSSTLYQHTL